MKNILFFSLLLATITMSAQIGTRLPSAQIGNSKWTLGGNAGLGGAVGSNGGGTTIYITPRAGYKVSENFEAGLAGNFSWNSSKYFSSTMLGIGPFANYYVGRSFYATGMFQHYFVGMKDKFYDVRYNTSEDALYLGGGYMQRLGERTYMQIGGMYNVLYNKDKSVFGGGLVPNIGIVYGL